MLSNPWFVGIGGGIICGIIVYFFAYYLVSRKENKLYNLKLKAANAEILSTIKPMISKDNLFDVKLFNSIISSTANNYDVDKNDLYSIELLVDDIITDIMQSPFLSIEQKDEYSKNLMEIKEKAPSADKPESRGVVKDNISSKYLSSLIALMTTMFAILSVLLLQSYQISIFEKNGLFNNSIEYFMLIIILPILSLVIVQFFDYIRKITRRNEYEESIEKKNGTENNEKEKIKKSSKN